ncbi:MAG: phytanoyl-CoA dioxygenase family protein [Pseudomonadota bacterium]
MLSQEQLDTYWEKGYVVVPGMMSAEVVADLSDAVDSFVEASRKIDKSDGVFDIDDAHTAENPILRRIKNPQDQHSAFKAVLSNPRVVQALTQILGPNVRLYTGTQKVNLKPVGEQAPVNWHQDWATYPHTNDSLVAMSVFIDDVTEENGPILGVPGTHRGPAYDHNGEDGFFVGAIDAKKTGLDVSKAESLTGPAGSVSFHHVRVVHGSVVNRSDHTRRLLIYACAAADAWPLSGTYTPRIIGPKEGESLTLEEYDARMISGEATLEPRLEKVPARLPQPIARNAGSVYEIQRNFEGSIDKDF